VLGFEAFAVDFQRIDAAAVILVGPSTKLGLGESVLSRSPADGDQEIL